MQKVAVVTGSAKGLGKVIARALAKEGYTVVVHFRKSKKAAEQTLGIVKRFSPKSVMVCADLTREDQVQRMFDEIFAKIGQVDLLVNNVGNFLYKPFGKTSNEEFREIFESNVYTTLYCSRAVLASMRKRKSGHIVNIGVVGAERLNLLEKSMPYFYAKNGVYAITKIVAHEEAKNGIHVNMISPASLETDIFKPSDFPMGRSATHDDIVKVLLFLISPDAYYINGANLEVAGGFIPGLT